MKLYLGIFFPVLIGIAILGIMDHAWFRENMAHPLVLAERLLEMFAAALIAPYILFLIIKAFKRIGSYAIKLYLVFFFFIIAVVAALDRAWFLATLHKPAEMAGWLVSLVFASLILTFCGLGFRRIVSRAIEIYSIKKEELWFFSLCSLIPMIYGFVKGDIDSSVSFGAYLLLIFIFTPLLFAGWRVLLGVIDRFRSGDQQYQFTNPEFIGINLLGLCLSIIINLQDPHLFSNKGIALFLLVTLYLVFSIIVYWFYFGIKALIRVIKYSDSRFEISEERFLYHGVVRDLALKWTDIESVEMVSAFAGVGPVPPRFGPSRVPGLLITSSGRTKPDLIKGKKTNEICSIILKEQEKRANPIES